MRNIWLRMSVFVCMCEEVCDARQKRKVNGTRQKIKKTTQNIRIYYWQNTKMKKNRNNHIECRNWKRSLATRRGWVRWWVRQKPATCGSIRPLEKYTLWKTIWIKFSAPPDPPSFHIFRWKSECVWFSIWSRFFVFVCIGTPPWLSLRQSGHDLDVALD